MLSRLLTSAVFAGAAAGGLAALLQLLFVQPVLLQAELYESGARVHFGASSSASVAGAGVGGFDALRDALTFVFTMLIYTGYGLILVALMSVAEGRGARISARTGLLWGVAGFVTVQLAPGFSLPPEVPGVAAVDVGVRQVWWGVTVLAAGGALWLLAFGRGWIAWGAAVLLLAAPHLAGAPQPVEFVGPVPPEIAALFAARALGVGLAAWVLLGAFAGAFWQREAAQAGRP